MAPVPKVKFYNGNEIPIFGLGTWKSKPGEVNQAVKDAIDIGYRHIDCAHFYGNEKEVGAAIKTKIQEGVIKREDIFITSKLWNTFHSPHLVEPSLKTTLVDLDVDYIDLYLMHWPFGYKEGGPLYPTDADGKVLFSDVDYVDTWKGLEGTHAKGLAKNIGISNFNSKQIGRLLSVAKVKPVVNQVECHPYLNQKKLSTFCESKGIAITAYSPLGSPDRPWTKPGDPQLLDDEKIKAIAKKHRKTPAQVVLRWQIQLGHVTIPKSVTISRIKENFQIFDFELSQDDMEQINSFDCNGRLVVLPSSASHPHYPFSIEF